MKCQLGVDDVDQIGFCIFNSLENEFRATGKNLQEYNKHYDIATIKEIVE